jgi:HK97 family phage portal protein
MTLPISSFFNAQAIPSGFKKGAPLFNDIPYTMSGQNTLLGGPNLNYREFWNQFKRSPELIAVLSVPITDIVGDRPHFVNPDGTPLGRNKRLEAHNFWRDNRMKESVKAGLYDGFVTGDAFWWIGKFTKAERLAKAKELLRPYAKLMSKENYAKLFIKTTQDEDLKKPRKFDYAASSTMIINHNQKDIGSYTQNVNGIFQTYLPEEIIHYRYFTVDGRVQGFSPVEALFSEIWLLRFIKENMLAYMRNGGSPSKVFILPEEISNSDNHRFLVQTLQRYNQVENRQGNLVFTGKIDIEDLAADPKDMEYKELALYVASNIAFAYRIPVTRIPYLVGEAASKGDSGGLAESGYWNMVSEIQDQIEDLLNGQLFEELGWHIKFDRKYKQDEIREAQALSMNVASVEGIQTVLMKTDKKISENYISNILNIPSTEMIELTPEEKMDEFQRTGMRNQNVLDKLSVEKEPDNRKKAAAKRNVANANINKDVAN